MTLRRISWHGRSAAIAVTSVCVFGATAQDIVTVRTVAVEDEPSPIAGVDYWAFSRPVISDAGEIAVLAFLRGDGVDSSNNLAVVHIASDGSATVVAREGDPAPGTGQIFTGLSGVSISENGIIAFAGQLGDEPEPTTSVWVGEPGAIQMIASTGVEAPGVAGATFVQFNQSPTNLADHPMIDASGGIVMRAMIDGDAIDAGRETGYWSSRSGSLLPVVRSGDDAPGLGSTFTDFVDFRARPAVNGGGRLAFLNRLADSRDAIWTDRDGVLELIAIEQAASPGGDAGETIVFLNHSPAISDTGLLVFSGLTSEFPGDRVWLDDGVTQAIIARGGVQSPGRPAGEMLTGPFDAVRVNDVGEAAILAFSDPDGDGPAYGRGAALLSRADGTLQMLLRAETDVPGTNREVSGIDLLLVLNNRGQVALQGRLAGGLEQGMWATDRAGGLQPIVLQGEPFAADPDDNRMVESYSVAFGNDSERRGNQIFNDSGALVFGVKFENGPHALVVASVDPEDDICVCESDGDDTVVDIRDLLAFLDAYFDALDAADLNTDGVVNIVDLLSFLDCWLPSSAGGACIGG